MLPEADLVFSQQLIPPSGMRCDSGHVASETFRRGGSGTPAEPTRWYDVTKIDRVFGKQVPKTLGTFCEPCVVLARHISNTKKEQKTGADIDPETVLRKKIKRRK